MYLFLFSSSLSSSASSFVFCGLPSLFLSSEGVVCDEPELTSWFATGEMRTVHLFAQAGEGGGGGASSSASSSASASASSASSSPAKRKGDEAAGDSATATAAKKGKM